MSEKQQITEEQGVHKQWYEEARKQTFETLPAFMDRVVNHYRHDYGTCVHATAVCAIAAAWAANNVLGLSGFQGGGVMWQFVREWNYSSNKCGLRIIDYDNVLYPQYADKYQGQSIGKDLWEAIQKEANERIQQNHAIGIEYAEQHAKWEQEIAAFRLAYPDYDERPEHYNRIGMGNAEQWEAERVKEESGFVFAPREPHAGTAHQKVLLHWHHIVQGKIPFGMTLNDE